MTGSFVLLGSVINTHFVFCFLLIDFFFLFSFGETGSFVQKKSFNGLNKSKKYENFFIFSSEFYHSCRKITRSGNVFGVLRSFLKEAPARKSFV